MKRLIQSFLTIAVAIIVLANLALVIAYSQQFQLRAQALIDCTDQACLSSTRTVDFIVLNSFLVGILLVVWFSLVRILDHRRPR